MPEEMSNANECPYHASKLWLGIAAGAAIGVAIALSRRKRSRWDTARDVGQRLSDRSGELSDVASNIIGRIKVIYEEGRKVAEDAGELWAQGRKLAGY